MQSKLNLLSSSGLRGLQMLFGIVVLGLSVTLINGHNKGWKNEKNPAAPPTTLPLAAAIGAVSVAAAVFSLVIAWTNFLREYIEMAVDVAVILLNVVGGIIIAIKLQGKNCSDQSEGNRFGSGKYPFKNSLGGIDILNGGCMDWPEDSGWEGGTFCVNTSDPTKFALLNERCKQSQTDSIFMFLTVVICFATMVLTFFRMKKNI